METELQFLERLRDGEYFYYDDLFKEIYKRMDILRDAISGGERQMKIKEKTFNEVYDDRLRNKLKDALFKAGEEYGEEEFKDALGVKNE